MLTIIWAFTELKSFCNSNIKDHHSKYNNISKVWIILRIIKMWHRDKKWAMLVENGASRLAHPFMGHCLVKAKGFA